MPNAPLSPAPPMWFRLPPGYHTLHAIAAAELEKTAAAVLMPILEGPSAVEQSVRDARTLARLLDAMRNGGSIHSSIGVHPDGKEGACLSLFSLSVIEIASRTPGLAVAHSALAVANSSRWSVNTRRLLELPIGLPAALVAGSLATPLHSQLDELGINATPSEVFQARLTVSYPSGRHIAVADLTSAATRHAEAYTDILEAIAQTVSFTAPTSPGTPARRASRILEVLS